MNRILPFLVALLVAGCTTIDYKAGPIPGLERMTIEEHFIDEAKIYEVCSRCGQSALVIPVACTCINLRTKHADIWLAKGASQSTIEHERAHGRGYDHTDGDLRRRYEAWQVSQKTASPLRAVNSVQVSNTQ